MDKSQIFKPVIEATNDVFISYALEKFRNIFRHCSYATDPCVHRLVSGCVGCVTTAVSAVFLFPPVFHNYASFIGFADNCISFFLKLA